MRRNGILQNFILKERKVIKLKTIFRTLCMMLALLLCFSALIACNKKTEENQEQTTGEEQTQENGTSTDQVDQNGYEIDGVGERDYGDKEIRILAWEDVRYNEFDVTMENATDVLSSAIWKRNLKVEDRLKVQLSVSKTKGNSGNMGNYLSAASARFQTGDIDAFASYSRVAGSMAINGMLTNLNAVNDLDFSKPWWSSGLVEEGTISGALYYCSGDISPSLISETMMVYFNKTMVTNHLSQTLEEMGYSDLYELTKDGQWTLGNMMTFCKDVGVSTDDVKDVNDTFGFAGGWVLYDAFYQGSGLRALDRGADGSVMISDDMGSSKTHNLANTLIDFLESADALGTTNWVHDGLSVTAWRNLNVMFFLDSVYDAPAFVDQGIPFGFLPIPKYDTAQENYYSLPGFYYTNWSIARSSDRVTETAATIEVLASEAHRLSAPAIYETILKAQSSETPEDYEMWDFLKSTICIDAGRVFDQCFNEKTWSIFRESVACRKRDYMGMYSTHSELLEIQASNLNALVSKLEG